METEVLKYIIVILGTIFISFIGAISGGIGLLFRPLLIFLGLPPAVAVGTARISYFGARISGIFQYQKNKKMDWKTSSIFIIPSIAGALLGTYIISTLSDTFITKFIACMILIGGTLLLFNPQIGTQKIAVKQDISPLDKILTFISFIFSNIIGATTGGAGILASYALIIFYKKTYIEAAAIRSVTGSISAIFSVLGFIIFGLIDWKYVPILFICTGIGNWFGVSWGIKKGDTFIRALTLIVIFASGIYMFLFK